MSKEVYERDSNGQVTHIRVTEDDGRTSYLYEVNRLTGGRSWCIEIADHHSDGTTTAWEFNGFGRGGKK